MSTTLRCPACHTDVEVTTTRFRCSCGEPLDAVHSYPPVSRGLFDQGLVFKELIYPSLELDAVVSQPEGNTPLNLAPSVARSAGVEQIRLKHEGMSPTGSFKDRGMTVAVSQGVAAGAKAFVCASVPPGFLRWRSNQSPHHHRSHDRGPGRGGSRFMTHPFAKPVEYCQDAALSGPACAATRPCGHPVSGVGGA